MQLVCYPYTLQLKNVFTLANSSRTVTPVILTEIHHGDFTGYGEASLPPYLGETQESVMKFLQRIDLSGFSSTTLIGEIMRYVDGIDVGNTAAKASVDIAIHDLAGKIKGKPCYELWGLNPEEAPATSFTIGIDSPEAVRKKAEEASAYSMIKVKLGKETDKMMIETIRSVTDKPICVDVNQGWTDKYFALDMLHWCKSQNVVFVEQPMPAEQCHDMAWLTAHSPIPTIADESFQRIGDLAAVKDVFSGINIKLMKCTGLNEAVKIIDRAKKMNLKIMLGCMTETSCAISAASQIASSADYIDLDGNLLITNDCFKGAKVQSGKVIPAALPGIGVIKCC
ncbi:MAG: dipeptide epimerase [Candidatus Azobacteroides sp.]|nr:dipeptide epimerase [Candidatus Azobacteroides sp.]